MIGTNRKEMINMRTSILVGITMTLLLLVLPASASDYTLGIFGNANEDETINMQDVTYTELIILEYRDQTELSDAKYDGKINMQDVTQIELVILGKEKELTLVDTADRTLTVNKPVERIIPLYSYDTEVIRILGEKDKIVGVGKSVKDRNAYYPEFSELPLVSGYGAGLDYETILNLNPDLVTIWPQHAAITDEKLPDSIAVAGFRFYKTDEMMGEMEKLGYILDKENRARYYIDDFYDKYIGLIKAQTEGLSEEKRPKVYLERYKAYKTYAGTCKDGTSYAQQAIDTAGGRNIFSDITVSGSSVFDVDPEEVAIRNPDIIIKYISGLRGNAGYGLDDTSEAKAVRDEILNRPELANVNAVKNNRVYLIEMGLNTGPGLPRAIAYWAKWFQPDLFEDLDPQAIHQEYLTEFHGLDFDVSEHGVFVYHPVEHPDGR